MQVRSLSRKERPKRSQDEPSTEKRPNDYEEKSSSVAPLMNSDLNVQAQPFVPKTFQKPNPAKNMTKLGKVKPKRRNNLNPTENVRPDTAPQTSNQRADSSSAHGHSDKSDALDLVRQFTTADAHIALPQNNQAAVQNKRSHGAQSGRRDIPSANQRKRNSNYQDYRQQGQVMSDKQRRHHQKIGRERREQQGVTAESNAERRRGERRRGERECSEQEARQKAEEDEKKAYLHRFEDKKPLNPLNYENHRGRISMLLVRIEEF